MSKGGFRPNSGRKKGSIPWNKGIPMSEASKRRVSESKKGIPAWNKGIPITAEAKAKMSLARKGVKRWPKGRVFSLEWRRKMSLAKLGKPSNYKGKKHSIENRLKMSIGRRKAYTESDFKYAYDEKNILRRDRKAVRRERQLKNGGCHSASEWNTLKRRYNFQCPGCKKYEPEIKLTRDHIVSLSNGGTDEITNIQPLCVKCNSSKSTKTIRYQT